MILFAGCGKHSQAANVAIDPGPGDDFPASRHFAIKVNGEPSFVYQNFKRTTAEKYLKVIKMDSMSWTSFVADQSTEVEVTFLEEESLDSIVVRPLSLGIEHEIVGNTVTFEVPVGRKVTIEKENDLKHVCFIFAHPEEPQPIGIEPENIITFERGIHRLDPDPLYIKGNQAVHLKPGAWIEGRIHGEDLDGAQIIGRGTLSATHVSRLDLKFGEGYAEKRLSRPLNVAGRNIRVHGPVIVDAPFWSTRIESDDPNGLNQVSHTSVLGWYVNSDGFQDMTHTRATDLFTCVNDDSFILNNTGDCVVERSVVWGQLAGAPLRLGWNGIEDLQPIIYRDIDILHFEGKAGVISLKHGGPSHVKDILIENIRIENTVHRLVELEIKKHLWAPKGTGFGQVSNIIIKDINVHKPLKTEIPSHINGANEDHVIRNVTLENISVAGEPVDDFEDLNLRLNEFTENINLKP